MYKLINIAIGKLILSHNMIFNEIVTSFNHVHKKILSTVGAFSKQTNILEVIENGLTQQLSILGTMGDSSLQQPKIILGHNLDEPFDHTKNPIQEFHHLSDNQSKREIRVDLPIFGDNVYDILSLETHVQPMYNQ